MRKSLFGILSLVMVATLAFSAVAKAEEVVKAEDDYKHYGVRVRGIFVAPDEKFDRKLTDAVGRVTVGNNFIPELDLEYFFTKKISAELIAGVTKHAIKVQGNNVGSTYLLPPSITLKYHPLAGAKYSPYIGAGIEITFPFNEEMNHDKNFKIDNSIGWAAQAGVDIQLKDNIYFNFDYKYLNIDTLARIGGIKYKVDLNPHLFGLGVGYRF